MANYENTRNKIRKNWEDSQENEHLIDINQEIQVKKEDQFVSLKPTNTIFNRVVDMSTEWVPLGAAWVFISDGSITERVVHWTITALIPESGITLAKFEPQYRVTDGSNPLAGVLNNYQHFISVEDAPNQPADVKRVTWYISWNIQHIGATYIDFEVRLLFTLPNPNLYI